MALEEQSRIRLGLLAMGVVPGHLPRGAHGVGWSAGQGKESPGCCSAKERQVALPGWRE